MGSVRKYHVLAQRPFGMSLGILLWAIITMLVELTFEPRHEISNNLTF